MASVLMPILPRLEVSVRPETPEMIENITKGTAMNFSKRMKI
jgi:hypothetical protein